MKVPCSYVCGACNFLTTFVTRPEKATDLIHLKFDLNSSLPNLITHFGYIIFTYAENLNTYKIWIVHKEKEICTII